MYQDSGKDIMYQYLAKMLYLVGLTADGIKRYIKDENIIGLYDSNDEKDVIKRRGIEANIILEAKYNHNSLSKRSKVKALTSKIYPDFIQNPLKYYDSYLFQRENIPLIFTPSEQKKINIIIDNLEQQAKYILKRGPKNDNETSLLMKYLKNNIDLDDDDQKAIIRKIIEENAPLSSTDEMEFFCSYVNRWMLKECGFEDIETAVFNCKLPCQGKAYKRIILIDNDSSAISVIQVVCHETQHVIQNIMSERLHKDNPNYEETKTGFMELERAVFPSEFFIKNYYMSRTEYEADEKGNEFTQKFLESFGIHYSILLPNLYKTGFICDFAISYTGNKLYEKEFSEYAYTSYWDVAIKDHDIEIEDYPILKRIYNADGTRKSFEEMINYDFSSELDLYMFYSFVFCHIQDDALDNFEVMENMEVIFNNINLICQKVLSKMKDFSTNGVIMLHSFNIAEMGKSEDNLSDSEADTIYKSETLYYTSFLIKTSKFLRRYLDKLDEEQRKKYEKQLEQSIEIIDETLRYHSNQFEANDIKNIESKKRYLMTLYNEARFEKVQKQYDSILREIVPESEMELNINFNGETYKLSEYVHNILPKYASISDITILDFDNNTISFDNHILTIVSEAKGYDKHLRDILILNNLIKVNFDCGEYDIRKDFIKYYEMIIDYYKETDPSYADTLRHILSKSNDYYQEHKFIDTLATLDLYGLSEEEEEVVKRSRKQI